MTSRIYEPPCRLAAILFVSGQIYNLRPWMKKILWIMKIHNGLPQFAIFIQEMK